MLTVKSFELILIRHAESSNNVLSRTIFDQLGADVDHKTFEYQDDRLRHPDSDLSTRGSEQVIELERFVESGKFENTFNLNFENMVVYCSPMLRCLKTCHGLVRGFKGSSTVYVNPILHESGGCYVKLGDDSKGMPGLKRSEIEISFRNFMCDSAITEQGWYGKPKMETAREFDIRCLEIVDWIWALAEQSTEQPADGMILVIHGNLMSGVLNALLAGVTRRALYIHNNVGITHLKLLTNGTRKIPVLQSFNRVDYLPDSLHTGNHLSKDTWIQEFLDTR